MKFFTARSILLSELLGSADLARDFYKDLATYNETFRVGHALEIKQGMVVGAAVIVERIKHLTSSCFGLSNYSRYEYALAWLESGLDGYRIPLESILVILD